MGWGNTNSDGESSQAPGSSQSTGGWGSSSYASQNSSPMSGGYRSDGGSSSGSGWGGQSTANPSITAQYGGGSSGSGNGSGSSSPMQSRVEAKVDAKNPANVTDRKASLTGGGLAGEVAAPDANYWSGPADAWQNNTNYTDGKAGQFGTKEHISALTSAINSGKANEEQIETARAMVAGANAVKGGEAAGGLLGTMGSVLAGPIGGYAAGKVGAWGAEKLSDISTGYADNAAYNQAKKLAGDDSSFVSSMAGKFSPVPGTSGMVKAVVGDYTGGFRQDMAGLNRSMINKGYIKAPSSIQQSGSSGSAPNSLLANMYQTQQQPAEAYSYEQPSLNYDNNASYYRGSVY